MVRRLALLVSAVAVAPVLSALPASAIPVCKDGYQCSRTYYADSAHSAIVGGFTRFCDGTTDTWGQTTAYQITSQVPCSSD